MKNKFYFNRPLSNLYLKPSRKSEVTSQIIYGEKFSILKKNKEWIKIKLKFDNYIGYIKNRKYESAFKAEYKIRNLKTKIFFLKKNKFKQSNQYLYFGSKIRILNKKGNYYEFERNKWINKISIIQDHHIDKNYIKIFKLFLNTKYLWGGKTVIGIDCSALIQMFFLYNNKFFPRDTKDQIKYSKTKIKNKFKKGDIIFWKGHVAICINGKELIHAYGPRKKVLIMPIKKTISLIEKTAKLKVKKICNIQQF